eukprot:SAG31_NODE_4409_length_3255_cov_1.603612_2_plen_684_part_00
MIDDAILQGLLSFGRDGSLAVIDESLVRHSSSDLSLTSSGTSHDSGSGAALAKDDTMPTAVPGRTQTASATAPTTAEAPSATTAQAVVATVSSAAASETSSAPAAKRSCMGTVDRGRFVGEGCQTAYATVMAENSQSYADRWCQLPMGCQLQGAGYGRQPQSTAPGREVEWEEHADHILNSGHLVDNSERGEIATDCIALDRIYMLNEPNMPSWLERSQVASASACQSRCARRDVSVVPCVGWTFCADRTKCGPRYHACFLVADGYKIRVMKDSGLVAGPVDCNNKKVQRSVPEQLTQQYLKASPRTSSQPSEGLPNSGLKSLSTKAESSPPASPPPKAPKLLPKQCVGSLKSGMFAGSDCGDAAASMPPSEMDAWCNRQAGCSLVELGTRKEPTMSTSKQSTMARSPCTSGLNVRHSTTNCSGHVGEACIYECSMGYVSTNAPHVCQPEGDFIGGECVPMREDEEMLTIPLSMQDCCHNMISGQCERPFDSEVKAIMRAHVATCAGAAAAPEDSVLSALLIDDCLRASKMTACGLQAVDSSRSCSVNGGRNQARKALCSAKEVYARSGPSIQNFVRASPNATELRQQYRYCLEQLPDSPNATEFVACLRLPPVVECVYVEEFAEGMKLCVTPSVLGRSCSLYSIGIGYNWQVSDGPFSRLDVAEVIRCCACELVPVSPNSFA